MADDGFIVKIHGLEDAAAELRALPAKLRKRAIMNSLRAAGRVIRDEARRLTPVIAVPVRRKGRLIRKPGTVRQALSVRTSKASTRAGNLGVFVNVRPAKGANKGKYNPFDPFYWRFIKVAGRTLSFLRGAAGRLGQAKEKFEATLGPQIQRLNRKGAQP